MCGNLATGKCTLLHPSQKSPKPTKNPVHVLKAFLTYLPYLSHTVYLRPDLWQGKQQSHFLFWQWECCGHLPPAVFVLFGDGESGNLFLMKENYGQVCSPALRKNPRAVRPFPRWPSHRGEEGDERLSRAWGKYCTCRSGIDQTSQLATALTT